MKKYKSSDLTHKRAEVLNEAAKNGVIIQQLETNGNIRREFVVCSKTIFDRLPIDDLDLMADKVNYDHVWNGEY